MKTIFIIPYQRDTVQRKQNTQLVVDYLVSLKLGEVVVSCTLKEKDDIVRCSKIMTNISDFNHKTLLINNAILNYHSDIVCVNDADVLVPKKSILESISAIKKGYEYSYPHYVKMYNIPRKLLDNNLENLNFSNNYPVLWDGSVGGIYFANRLSFLAAGAENELMKGWGMEDFERIERMRRLFLKIHYATYNIWHIEHKRKKENSQEGSLFQTNMKIYENILNMKYANIPNYIQSWTKRWTTFE